MRSVTTFILLLGLLPSVLADVKFTSPSAGLAVPGGVEFTITWTDSGTAPSLSDLSAYQLFLFTGSNTQPQQLSLLSNGVFTAAPSVSVTVPVGTGASTPLNA